MGRVFFLILCLAFQTGCGKTPNEKNQCERFLPEFHKNNSRLTMVKGKLKSFSDPWLYAYEPLQVKKYFLINNYILDMPDKDTYEFSYYLTNDVLNNPKIPINIKPDFKTCLDSLNSDQLENIGFTYLTLKMKCIGKCRVDANAAEREYNLLYSHAYHSTETISLKYTINTDFDSVDGNLLSIKNADAILSLQVFSQNVLVQSNSIAILASDDSGH